MKKVAGVFIVSICLLAAAWFLLPEYLEQSMGPADKQHAEKEDGTTNGEKENRDSAENVDEEEEKAKPQKATILAVGDIMVHGPQLDEAERLGKEQGRDYHFKPSFEYISPYLEDADVAVANLETTLGPGEPSCFPLFSSPDELAVDLKNAGFDLLCTANNHSLDTGEEGLYRTLDILDEVGLKTFGTARSREERENPLIVDINGIDVAFLAYTDNTNGIPIPEGKDYIVNYLNVGSKEGFREARLMIEKDISRARRQGADIVAVYMHWGPEYLLPGPHDIQERLARKVAESGGDIIFGSHPHVIQPMEYLEVEKEDGSLHEALVVYSMGNFVSNQHKIPGSIPTEEVKYGLAVQVHLKQESESSSAVIDEVDYLITWVNRDHKYQIIPVHYLIESSPQDYHVPENKYRRIEPVTEDTIHRLNSFLPVTSLKEAVTN